jgi:hypothetical protein
MHTQDIAANVPALTRDYIHLAIQEALAPAIEEIFTEISKAKAMASKPQNPQAIASEVAQTVEASISNGLSQIINQRFSQARQELVDSIDTIRADIDSCRQSADKALSAAEYLAQNQSKPAEPTPAIDLAPILKSIDDINLALQSIKSPDTLAQIVANQVEASISASVASQVEQRSSLLRDELNTILAQIQEETVKTEASADRLLAAVANLEAKVRKWLDRDRYSLTRAQVIKAMREKSNG